MRAAWLEDHVEFEGVGAHELNPRYDHVDGDLGELPRDFDQWMRRLAYEVVSPEAVPALTLAKSFLSATAVRLSGADLSHHNADAGPIDWPTLRAASLDGFVATKATQSTGYLDPTFMAHRAQMGAQGFQHRGLYHWLSGTTAPRAQAAHFLDAVGTLQPGEFVMLDAEERGITAAMVLDWVAAVEVATGRPASVYSGAYVAGGTIWQSTAIRTSPFGARPMHLAAYTTEEKAKKLPGVAAYPWDAWQWSSNGPVPGVVGRCDQNRNDNLPAYDLAAGVIPAPNPLPEDDVIDVVRDAETSLDKFAVMPDGTLRALSATELKARGIANSQALGTPLTKAERDQMGVYVAAPVPVIPPLTGHIAADIDTGTWHVTGSIG